MKRKIEKIALEEDSLFDFIRDARITSVITTPAGIPIPDEKPDNVPASAWELFKDMYTNHSQLGGQ